MPRPRRHPDPLVEFFELLLELLSELLSGEGKKHYSRRKSRDSQRKSYYAQCITEDEPLPPEPRGSVATAPEVPPPYAVVPAFMTPAEAAFDLVLCECVDDPLLRVHRKVRMADVLQVVSPSKSDSWSAPARYEDDTGPVAILILTMLGKDLVAE